MGVPLYEQVVYAAKKAILAGQLRAGELFPPVRAKRAASSRGEKNELLEGQAALAKHWVRLDGGKR